MTNQPELKWTDFPDEIFMHGNGDCTYLRAPDESHNVRYIKDGSPSPIIPEDAVQRTIDLHKAYGLPYTGEKQPVTDDVPLKKVRNLLERIKYREDLIRGGFTDSGLVLVDIAELKTLITHAMKVQSK